MMLHTKEHYEIMQAFEKIYKHMRLDKEVDKDVWKKYQSIYESGETNDLFLAFRAGYSFCECVNR